MRHAIVLIMLAVHDVILAAAPVPPDVKSLVAGLSDPSQKVRDEAVAALRARQDAGPWLRRAARSMDRDTARRATALLDVYPKKRQEVAKQAIEACIRTGQADLFVEWHQFWQPESKADLWPVGPRMGKAALDAFAARQSAEVSAALEQRLAREYGRPPDQFGTYDGPWPVKVGSHARPWLVRTDQMWLWTSYRVAFASVAGSIRMSRFQNGYFFTLGEFDALGRNTMVVAVCDGRITGHEFDHAVRGGIEKGPSFIGWSFLASRGNAVMPNADVIDSVILVDGDIDLSRSSELKGSLIRASGEIRLRKGYTPENCTIEAHAENPTAPYKFFELADVGLSLRDDEEGLVVADVKPKTPFGNSGIATGDIIRAIDDAPAGHSEQFRKLVRKALVRQGDCLVTVARGNKTLDLAVYFPLPK